MTTPRRSGKDRPVTFRAIGTNGYIETMLRRLVLVGALFVACSACIDQKTARKAIEGIQGSGVEPDELPTILNTELPFRYPVTLYDRQVQGNVTLRIHIDSVGNVVPDSTAVVESSGYSGLDSAAVLGSRDLRFTPARLHNRPMSVSILLPVYFRHPDARPLPGDTVLRKEKAENRQQKAETARADTALSP
jgi:TonB family protein